MDPCAIQTSSIEEFHAATSIVLDMAMHNTAPANGIQLDIAITAAQHRCYLPERVVRPVRVAMHAAFENRREKSLDSIQISG